MIERKELKTNRDVAQGPINYYVKYSSARVTWLPLRSFHFFLQCPFATYDSILFHACPIIREREREREVLYLQTFVSLGSLVALKVESVSLLFSPRIFTNGMGIYLLSRNIIDNEREKFNVEKYRFIYETRNSGRKYFP